MSGVNCQGSIVGGSIVVLSPIFRDNLPQCNYIGGQLSGGHLSGVNCRGVNCRGSIVGGQFSGGQLSRYRSYNSPTGC